MLEIYKRLEIELTNHCNLSCYMCPNNICPEAQVPRTEQSLENIQKIVDKFPNVKSINFGGLGEPCMYSKWKELCEFMQKRELIMSFTTNGTLLDKEHIKCLPDHLTRVYLSLDTVDEELYKKKKGGASLTTVKENMNNLVARGDIGLFISSLVSWDNIDYLPSVVDYAKEIKVTQMHFTYPRIHRKGDFKMLSPFNDLFFIPKMRYIHQYAMDKGISVGNVRTSFFPVICRNPQDQCTISMDGTIWPCCYINMDKIGKGSYNEVLFGKEYEIPSKNFVLGNVFKEDSIDYDKWNRVSQMACGPVPGEHYGLVYLLEVGINYKEDVNYCLVCGHRWGYMC